MLQGRPVKDCPEPVLGKDFLSAEGRKTKSECLEQPALGRH